MLTAILLAAPAAAFQATLLFNMSFSDMHAFYQWTSPAFAPRQAINTSMPGMWNTSFADTPWSTYAPGIIGGGASTHARYNVSASATETNGINHAGQIAGLSTLSLVFYGAGAWVDCRLSMTPHGGYDPYAIMRVGSATMNIVKPVSGLVGREVDVGRQETSLSVYGGDVEVTGLTLTLGIQSQARRIEDVPRAVQPWILDGQLNSFFSYRGGWEVRHELGGGGGQAAIAYEHAVASSPDNSAAVTTLFSVPANTTMLIINGTLGPMNGQAAITVLPPVLSAEQLPRTTNVSDPAYALGARVIHSVFNWWTQPDAVIYLAVLDPTVQYNVTIAPYGLTAADKVYGEIGLHSVTFYAGGAPDGTTSTSPTPTGDPSHLSKGAIAGIVIGAVVGLALIAAAAYFLAWKHIRRRMAKQRQADPLSFVVDDDCKATPYKRNAPNAPSVPLRTSKFAPAVPVAPFDDEVHVLQAQDVGTVKRVEWVPPQYDPAWNKPQDNGQSSDK